MNSVTYPCWSASELLLTLGAKTIHKIKHFVNQIEMSTISLNFVFIWMADKLCSSARD